MEIQDWAIEEQESCLYSVSDRFEYLPKLPLKSGVLAETVTVLGVLQSGGTITLFSQLASLEIII